MNLNIKNYHIKNIEYIQPESFFYTLERGVFPSLLTGEGPGEITKESYIGVSPSYSFTTSTLDNLWKEFRRVINSTDFNKYTYPINRLGAIGYLSYEALHSLEKIKKGTVDHFSFPLLNLTLYNKYYFFDNENKIAWEIDLEYEESKNYQSSEHLNSFESCDNFNVTNLISDITKDSYINNVNTIKDKIINGDVYEVNYTQGILGDFSGSPLGLFKKLYNLNKAPYSAYLERENYTIVSNSPEMFLKVEEGIVETRPIKGTIRRADNSEEDSKLQEELLSSKKNQAELYMIVDLMRNDLSKVCEIGSVVVADRKRVEKYQNVHHLVSTIQGKLEKKYDIIDLLKATFPGGSITGCPKVRCMEITEEIEQSSRNLYTGTIFIGNTEYFNSSIVIRSAVIKNGKILFNSGGAITIDSDPEDEYSETLVKLKSIFRTVDYDNFI